MAGHRIEEHMQILKQQLTSGCCRETEKEIFYHTQRTAKKYPMLKPQPERRNTLQKNETNVSKDFSIVTYLEKNLDERVYNQILGDVIKLQKSVTHALWNDCENYCCRYVNFFFISHVDEKESQLQVCYVEVTPTVTCSRKLYSTNYTLKITGEYIISTFNVKNTLLIQKMREENEKTMDKVMEWMKHHT